jgi:hypothetical protein
MLEGRLQRMSVDPGDPARYQLVLDARDVAPGTSDVVTDGDIRLELNHLINKWLRIEFKNRITCLACGSETRGSYGDGHCYRCFRSLARCDLCVVSPARCHYAQGTCREPEWGEAFCMQPHLVYLANSSGPKVGITTEGGQMTRWLDQGATQGLVVARTVSRHLAGVLEERLARRVSDRTDWRALLRRDAAPVDLLALQRTLRGSVPHLPEGVRWAEGEDVVALTYPVLSYPGSRRQFRLEDAGAVSGRLLGIKGQYLLFDHGVLNVRRHRGFHVSVIFGESPGPVSPALDTDSRHSQLELLL